MRMLISNLWTFGSSFLFEIKDLILKGNEFWLKSQGILTKSLNATKER